MLIVLLSAALLVVEHPRLAEHPPHIQEALNEARNAFLNAPPDSGSAFGELGMVYHANGFAKPAGQAYDEALRLAPADARWPYYRGLLAFENGDFESARQHWELSLEINPEYGPAKVRLAQARLALNDTRAARRLISEAIEEFPRLAAAHAALGQLEHREGKHKRAVEHLTQALTLQPSALALYNPLGLSYRALGQVDEARSALANAGTREVVLDDPLNRSLRSRSRSFSYFLTLGIQAAEANDLAQGITYLGKARDAAPDNVNVLVTLARVLEADGQVAPAVEAVDAALAVDGNSALALEQRAVLYEMQDNTVAAKASYERALAADPSLYDARRFLARAHMRDGLYADAAAELGRLRASFPLDGMVALQLAVSQYEGGDCVLAANTLQERLRQQPEPGALLAYIRVVASCEAAGEKHQQQALGSARQYYGVEPGLHATTSLAMIEMAAGNGEEAIAYQQQAIFSGLRDQIAAAELEALRETLARYEQGERPDRPWARDHSIARPAALQPGDR